MSAATAPIPLHVEKFISTLPPSPVALIGCRALNESLECCEYDIAIFAKPEKAQVVRLEGQTVELLYLEEMKGNIADLYGMKILRDNNAFKLASVASAMTLEKFRKALRAHGRKLLVSSLFCQRRAEQATEPIIAQIWTKIAAYRFISGAIALSGKRPMPAHELGQARQLESSGTVAEGMAASLECIGLERATRPTLRRSIEAMRELKSKDYDRDLVMSKTDFLLGRQMLSDCYYYIGKSAGENLEKRNDSFYRQYSKLIQLALDLTSEIQTDKLRRSLFKAATETLKA